MSDVLLQYAFKVTATTPTPQADTSMLRQALIIVKPKEAVPATIVECDSAADIALLTDNTDGQELLTGGMSSVLVLPSADLDVDAILDAHLNEFYTVIVSSDFTTANVDAADFGDFAGVIAYADDDKAWLKTWAVTSKHIGFYSVTATKAKNLCYAMGKFLSSVGWKNQQYIEVPYDDLVATNGEADSLFNDHISFVITSPEYGKRLAFFGNAKAITAPYVLKEIEILTQSEAVSYISANQPAYIIREAVLLEGALNKVIAVYVDNGTIESGKVVITLVNDNFVATGAITLTEPRALWRVNASLVAE